MFLNISSKGLFYGVFGVNIYVYLLGSVLNVEIFGV